MRSSPPIQHDPPSQPEAPTRDAPPGEFDRGPMVEPLTAPSVFKPTPPPLAPIWPKGGQPSYRPKLRPR